MDSIKYVNFKEIGSVVIEIWGVENGDLVVPVNTVYCISFEVEKLHGCRTKL